MIAQEMKGVFRIFIFVDTTPGKDMAVLDKILEFDEVKEVHIISGQYDLLAVLEISIHGHSIFTSVQELAQKVIQKIRKIGGVRDTSTIVPFVSMAK